ncbi:hypothetical protein EAF04_001782 [Stromatinia cepivora]|nr:hypothetical protein EAF04_001782 [Stromatinia cepivora]
MNFGPISLVTLITAISSLTAPVNNLATLTTSTPITIITPTLPSSTPTVFPSSTPTISPSQTPPLHTPEPTIRAVSLTGRFWTEVPLTGLLEGYDGILMRVSTVLWYPSLGGSLGVINGVGRNAAGNAVVTSITITEIRKTEILVRDMGVGFLPEREGLKEGVDGDLGEVSWGGDGEGEGEGEVEMVGNATNGTEQRIRTNEGMTTSSTMGMRAGSNNTASVSPSNLPTGPTIMTATEPSNTAPEYPPQTSANASNPGASQCSSFANRLAILALVKDNTRRNPNAVSNEYQTSLLDNITSHLNSEDAGNLRHAVNGEPDLDKGSDTDGEGEKGSSLDEGSYEGSDSASDEGSGPDDGPESDPDDNGRPYEKYNRLNSSSDDDDYDDEGDWASDSDPPSEGDNYSEHPKDPDNSTRPNGKTDKRAKERDSGCASKQNSSPEPSSQEEGSRQTKNGVYIPISKYLSHHCRNNQSQISTLSNSDTDLDMDLDMDIYPSEIDEELLDEFWGLQVDSKFSDDESSGNERDLNGVIVEDENSNKRRRGSCATSDVFDRGFGCVFGLNRGLDIGVPCGKRRKIFDGDVDADAQEMHFGGVEFGGFDFNMEQDDDFICKDTTFKSGKVAEETLEMDVDVEEVPWVPIRTALEIVERDELDAEEVARSPIHSMKMVE